MGDQHNMMQLAVEEKRPGECSAGGWFNCFEGAVLVFFFCFLDFASCKQWILARNVGEPP